MLFSWSRSESLRKRRRGEKKCELRGKVSPLVIFALHHIARGRMMQEQVSIAKITRPRLPDVLPRTRLFHLLDQARKRSPVIWISGPAGSGKTTLVSSYLDTRKLPCLWYQTDEGDADPATFFYYMGIAARKAAPRHKRPLPLLTPEYGFGIPTFTRRYFENLCSRLNQAAHALVFDNYQDVPSESAFHEIIRAGLSALPENITAVIISRSEPPAVLSGLQAGNHLHVIGWNDLKLTLEESKGIAQLQEVGRPSVLEWLHEKAHGWTAGLVLLTRVVKSEDVHPEALQDLAPEKVFDYFANELFGRLDVPMQDFLLKTAFAPKLTPGLAEELTGNKAAGKILSDLNRRNYFTEKRTYPDIVYQYHALFREFLLTHAASRFRPAERCSLQLKAAKLLEAAGQVEDAADLYVQAGAAEELSRLIMNHAQSFIMQGRGTTVEKWLEKIPAEIASGRPWLSYWMGACSLPFKPVESREWFERAFRQFEHQEDCAGVFLAWIGIAEAIWFAFEDLTKLDGSVTELYRLKRKFGIPPSQDIEARIAAVMVQILTARQLNHPEFEVFLQCALSAGDTGAKLDALAHLAIRETSRGELAKAEDTFHSLHELLKMPQVGHLQSITTKVYETFSCIYRGTFDHGIELATEALEMADATGVHTLDLMAAGNGIINALNAGRADKARVFSGRLPSHDGDLRIWDKSFHHYLRTSEAINGGDYSSALMHAEESLKFADRVQFPTCRIWCRLVNAFVLHELGNYPHADALLDQALRISHESGYELTLVECYLTKAYFAMGRKKNASTLNYLKEALEKGRRMGVKGGYVLLKHQYIAPLLVKALEHNIEADYVRELIRLKNIVPEEPPLHIENWPWPVKIFTFGQFALEIDCKALTFEGKTPKKPFELLKAIIALGGRGVSEERIIDTLWPEAAGDLAHKSFEMALQRLRKLIGFDNAVRRQDGVLTIDDRYCWTDVWAFEQLVQDAAEREVRNAGPDERNEKQKQESRVHHMKSAIEPFEKAIRLYKGHFLAADARQSWITLTRERLRSKFLRLVTRAGEQYEQNNEWKKAVECFERGLERDGICEEFYQHLMVCHNKLGHRSETAKAYQRCCAALRHGLGLEPSSRTKEIYSMTLDKP